MLALPKIPRVQPWMSTAKGLIGCWPFFEGVGLVLHDVSGYGLDATITGASWVNGPGAGPLLEFNATGAQALTGNPQWAPVTNTVTMIVRAVCEISLAPPQTTYRYHGLLTARLMPAATQVMGMDLSDNGGGGSPGTGSPITTVWNNTAAEYGASTGLFPTVGVPFLAAGIVAPGALTTWLIDEVGGAVSFTLTQSNPARALSVPWTIGNDAITSVGVGAWFWPGRIFEARLYDRVLAPSELWDIYTGNG